MSTQDSTGALPIARASKRDLLEVDADTVGVIRDALFLDLDTESEGSPHPEDGELACQLWRHRVVSTIAVLDQIGWATLPRPSAIRGALAVTVAVNAIAREAYGDVESKPDGAGLRVARRLHITPSSTPWWEGGAIASAA